MKRSYKGLVLTEVDAEKGEHKIQLDSKLNINQTWLQYVEQATENDEEDDKQQLKTDAQYADASEEWMFVHQHELEVKKK